MLLYREFFSRLQDYFFSLWSNELCVVVYRKQKKQSNIWFDLKNAKALPGLIALTSPVLMAITILLEITVPGRREPTMASFVFLSNVSDKRLRRLFLLKVGYLHFFGTMFSRVFRCTFEGKFCVLFWKLFKDIFSTMILNIPPNLSSNMFWYVVVMIFPSSWLFHLIYDHFNFSLLTFSVA